MRFLITTDNGFELVLFNEIRELIDIYRVERIFSGRILIETDDSVDTLVSILRSRIANNIYLLIEKFDNVESLDDIYRHIKSLDYTTLIKPSESFAIRSSRIGQHNFTSIDIARVAGQAVIDSYRDATGTRLKVDLENPDIEIYVELNNKTLYVGLFVTKSSLHKRGYRVYNHPAALKTTIAVGMLRLAEWKPGEPILDPMCGSGTIVIEAALTSKGIEIPCFKLHEILGNPGISRLYPELHDRIQRLCISTPRDVDRVHIGIDINPIHIEGAAINAHMARVIDTTMFFVGDSTRDLSRILKILEHEGIVPRIAVMNPPYGHKMYRHGLDYLYYKVLSNLIELGFESVCFITSAIDVAEKVLMELDPGEVKRLYVVHGTLPSYVYTVKP